MILPTLGFITGRLWGRRGNLSVSQAVATVAGSAADTVGNPAGGDRAATTAAGGGTTVNSVEWPDDEIAALDAALAAERSGDREKAAALARAQAEKLKNPRQVAVMNIYLAELAIRERRGRDAQTLLFPLTRSGPDVAVASDRLAFIQCRSRRFDEAMEYFSNAAHHAPLAGLYFYRWGEALRRQGKLQDAIARFEQAQLRQRASDPLGAPAITGLKLRLTRIEAGQIADVRAETEERLRAFADPALPSPLDAGEWMLTAAALDLQEDKFASAAEWLKKARALLPGGRYEDQMADYFFRNFAHRPELAAVLPTPAEADTRRQALAARPDVYFVDP